MAISHFREKSSKLKAQSSKFLNSQIPIFHLLKKSINQSINQSVNQSIAGPLVNFRADIRIFKPVQR